MNLSNEPTWRLIMLGQKYQSQNVQDVIDEELDQRQLPDHFYFGDCAGEPVFVPIELDVTSEIIGNDGEEIIWS